VGLNVEAKQVIVQEVATIAARASSVIAAEYTGLTVAEMTRLRKSARDVGVQVKVVRNTLARRAFEGTGFECMNQGLLGPLLLVFSNDEPGNAAQVVRDFTVGNDKLIVKLIALDGRLLDPADLQKLASLPTLDQARSMLLSLLQAPHGKFVRVAAELQVGLVRLLAAYRDQRAD